MSMRRLMDNNSTEKKVLSYIVRKGASSRKEISEQIGVTTATLSRVVSSLMEQGILRELGTVEDGRVGRKQVILDIREDLGYVMGFDVTNIYIRITVMDLRTKILELRRWNFSALTQEILDEAIAYAMSLMDKYCVEKILGIGLLMQGYIEQNACFSLPIHNIWDQLQQRLKVDIYMLNNVKGLAVAESYFGNPCQNYVAVKYGPGVGGVIVQNGEIVEGSTHSAGELGHIVWDPHSTRECLICGKHGCLESFIGYASIIERAAPDMKVDYPDLAAVLEASKNDHYQALYKAFHDLALAVNMMVDLVDPQEVLLAGEIFQDDNFFEKFVSQLKKNNPRISKKGVYRIVNYQQKRICAAGVVVLNHYFGKGFNGNHSMK